MAEKWKKPKQDVWVRDNYGTNKKVDAFVKSQGGNEWDAAGFRNFMNYRTARQETDNKSAQTAASNWTKSYNDNQDKLQEKWNREAEEKRKKKEAEAKQQREREQIQANNKNPKKNSFIDDLLSMAPIALKQALTGKPQGTEATKLALDYVKQGKRPSDATKELARGITRVSGFGLPEEIAKKKNDTYFQNEVFNERKGGEKAADFVYDALGYLVPGAAAYKGLNALKAGKALTEFGGKSLAKRLASESAKGAIIGAGLSSAEVAGKYMVNPQDQNLSDNLKYIAQSTALGAVADPALYGAGKAIGKGFESAANHSMQNMLPNKDEAAKRLSELIRTYHQEQAPIPGKPDLRGMNELLPSGNGITNPNFVPKMNPQVKPEITVPKYGQSLEEALANPRPDIPEIPEVAAPKANEPVPQPKVVPEADTSHNAEQPAKRSTKLEDIVKENGFNDVTPETVAKSYNNKTWYHGTGTGNLTADTLDPFVGDHQSLFGHGIYLTDEPAIAEGYAKSRSKRTKTPSVYEANVKMDKVLDLEQPVTNEAKEALLKMAKPLDYHYKRETWEEAPYFSDIIEEMSNKGATTEQIIQRMRSEVTDFSHENGISTNEFVEVFQDLAAYLKQNGYDGITHTGGGRTGKDPHRVLIALDPNDAYSGTGRSGQITKFDVRKEVTGKSPTTEQPKPAPKTKEAPKQEEPVKQQETPKQVNELSQQRETVSKPSRAQQLRNKADQLEKEAQRLREQTETDTSGIVPGQPIQKGKDYSEPLRAREEKRQALLKQAEELRKQSEASEVHQANKEKRAGMSDVEKKINKTEKDLNKAKSQLKAAESGKSPALEPFINDLRKEVPKLEKRLAKLVQQNEEALRLENEALINSPKDEMPNEEPVQLFGDNLKEAEAPKTNEAPKEEVPVKQQGTLPKKSNERSFPNTVLGSDKLTPEVRARIEQFDKGYTPMKNEELVQQANEYIAGNGIEKSYQFVKNANKLDPRHIAVGQRLIDELSKAKGQENKVLDLIEKLSESGTTHGQSIQSFSLYNKLSVEGQLLRVQRHVNRLNEGVVDPKKQVKLTEQHIQDITHTADSIQKLTGQTEQANNVIKIMDRIKKGNVATDAELDMVRSFVSDAKKFVGDLDPKAKPPKVKAPKEVRARDKVVDFMDKKEAVAREELKKIFGRANSLPVDAFYHLSTIGASKIAKGTVKLADFTEEMVKDFGEMVRPYAKQIYNKAVETFNLQSESMTHQRLSEIEKITNKALKDKNIDADQADTIREFARQVGLMSGDARLENSMELQSILQTLERPTFGRRLATAQTIGQLLNPKTIVRNAIGNELFYRVEQINKLVATPVDILRSKITGGERTITFRTHNQGQYWKNFMVGAKAGWKGVNPMGLQTAYDLGPQAFRSKFNPLTYMEKSLGATLRSFDHAAYTRAYNSTIGELATLKAVNQGLKGQAKKDAIKQFIREADDNMIAMADQYGKYTTFQDSTALSTGLQKVKKAMNFKQDFGLGDLILKYPKTPGNLVMRALEYSPAGVLRSASLIKNMRITKSSEATREFYLSLTRAITGTAGFSVLGYALADAGVLTAGGNSDYEIAQLEKSAGKQPNSVNVSALNRFVQSGFNIKKAGTKKGDTFVSYDWAQPVSIAMSLGSGVNQSKKESGALNAVDMAKGAFDSSSKTIINMSVLKGLNDFMASYPGREVSDRFADVAKGLPSSFTPTFLNQIRQLNNNDARTTYDDTFSGETMNRVLNRIPGLDKKLPLSYDTLGNKRETYQDGSNSLLNVFLNPSFVSKYKPSEEAQFVLDHINETGDSTVAPRIVKKKLDGTKLNGEQFSELQRITGQETLKGLKELLPELKKSDDPAAVSKKLYDLLNAASKKGKAELRNQFVTKEQLDEARKKYGLDAETVYDRINKGMTLNKALTKPIK